MAANDFGATNKDNRKELNPLAELRRMRVQSAIWEQHSVLNTVHVSEGGAAENYGRAAHSWLERGTRDGRWLQIEHAEAVWVAGNRAAAQHFFLC